MFEQSIFFPGSFDPFTKGHEEIVSRILILFPGAKVMIAIAPNLNKQSCFSIPERMDLIEALYKKQPLVQVVSFSGLLVEAMREYKVKIIVRGVRNTDDFAYEVKLATMNQHLDAEVETLFLASNPRQSFISSSLVKEVALLGGNVGRFVSPVVCSALEEKRLMLGKR